MFGFIKEIFEDVFGRDKRKYHYTFYDKIVEVDSKRYQIELRSVHTSYIMESEVNIPGRVVLNTPVDIYIDGNNTFQPLSLTEEYTPEQYLKDIAAAVDAYRKKKYQQGKLNNQWSDFRGKK